MAYRVSKRMNSLSRFTIIRCLPPLVRPFCSKGESPWYIDNKPGPYPKTEEEMCAAAKKYGMLREEYEPYPDDGNGYGDYPKILPENVESKDPYYPWNDTLYSRNFNDPIPVDFPYYTTGRISNERQHHSTLYMISCFLLGVGLIALPFYIPQIAEYRYHAPIMEKQYPKPGVTHYTFDFVDEGSTLKH